MVEECKRCGGKGFIEKIIDCGTIGKFRLIFPCVPCEIFSPQDLFEEVYINRETNVISIRRRKSGCPDVLLELELDKIHTIRVEIGAITGNKETFLEDRTKTIDVLYEYTEHINVLSIENVQCVCIDKAGVLVLYKFLYQKPMLNFLEHHALRFYGDPLRKKIIELTKE